jgi:SAM-dependent methyltransferase
MSPERPATSSLTSALRDWWKDRVAIHGRVTSAGMLAKELWEFARDSTPARRRQRFGDVDYDWDYRVDTTGATVGWRDRLLGVLHSPYQPTEPALFHEMLDSLATKFGGAPPTLACTERTRTWGTEPLDFRQLVFVDLGSGKGRTLLMASDYPFKRIIGVELLPELHRVAEENLRKYKSGSQKCSEIVAQCGDAREFEFPVEPMILYLFNPLPRAGLEQVIAKLEGSVRTHTREVYVLYHNPLLEDVFAKSGAWTKVAGTHQWVGYKASSC